MKTLRHQFTTTGLTEHCDRCGVERSRCSSRRLPEYRLEGGTWSFADPGCRDPRQSDIFAPDLSPPEGFAPIERAASPTPTTALVERPADVLQKQIDEIFTRPRPRSDEEDALDLNDVLSMFKGAAISDAPLADHRIDIHHENATISLAIDPEGRHLGIQERWHVFAFSPRPLAKGLEQIVEGTLGDALTKTEWMKKVLVFRPEAILVIDGPRKRIELKQHPASKKTKAFWSVSEILKKEVDAT